MKEVERKFLVTDDSYKAEAFKKTQIFQGYLNSHQHRTVRVRIFGEQGFLTIKGKSNESGTTRFEWEKEIPLAEAKELLKLCEPGIIDKNRYEIKIGKHVVEVDEFFGENEGLIVAEIELDSETESYLKPDWLGKEVTGELKYYNAMLSKNPYSNWT